MQAGVAAGHARLQPPQWVGSLRVSTHMPPIPGTAHPLCPGGHIMHSPPAQASPAAQGRPHPPQWAGSPRVSTQAEPQRVWPAAHAPTTPQRPAAHA